jgi:hypothetical protein
MGQNFCKFFVSGTDGGDEGIDFFGVFDALVTGAF